MSRLLSIAAVSLIAVAALPVSAQQQAASAVNTVRSTVSKAALAKERALTMIQGNALSSSNGPLNDVTLRLRDARWGRIVDTQRTDRSGLFAFKAIDPGSYIVEIMSNDQSIMAASQLLNINAGEVVSAVVKLPFRIPPFAGLIGQTSMPSAAAVTAEALLSGVTAIVPTIPVSAIQ